MLGIINGANGELHNKTLDEYIKILIDKTTLLLFFHRKK